MGEGQYFVQVDIRDIIRYVVWVWIVRGTNSAVLEPAAKINPATRERRLRRRPRPGFYIARAGARFAVGKPRPLWWDTRPIIKSSHSTWLNGRNGRTFSKQLLCSSPLHSRECIQLILRRAWGERAFPFFPRRFASIFFAF